MSKISFAIPKYASAYIEFIRELKKQLRTFDTYLSSIRSISVSHKGKVRQLSLPTILETSSQFFEGKLFYDEDTILKTNIDKFSIKFYELCEKIFSQQTKHFQKIKRQISDAEGTTFDIKNKNWGDVYLEMLEKRYIRFDEEGNYKLEITGNSKTLEKIAQNPLNENQLQKKKDIINQKKERFFKYRRKRRLI